MVGQKEIQICILGAGSIGSLFGGYLSSIKSTQFSIRMVFFGRSPHIDVINKHGLTIKSNFNEFIVSNIECYRNFEEYLKLQTNNENHLNFDYLFITTKSYDLESAVNQYLQLIQKCKLVVVLQNGVDNEDILRNYCEDEKITRAITSNGANLIEPGKVIHTGRGLTEIGYPFETTDEESKLRPILSEGIELLKDLLEMCSFETEIRNNIKESSWNKVFVNVGINAIGALTNLKNGELLKHEGLVRFMKKAVKEAVMVANKMGYRFNLDECLRNMLEVAKKTSENKNSMLQDIIKSKKTEIDYFNGKIIKNAQKFNLNAPINELLTNLIKGLENSYIF